MLSFLPSDVFERIYEPREDTHLLVDALQQDVALLRALNPCVCVEVGPGSGFVSASLSALLPSLSLVFFGADLNAEAARVSRDTFVHNNSTTTAPRRPHSMDCVVADLADCFVERLAGAVDVLLFNPPYVPTDDAELGHTDLRAAWAGGAKGRVVIDRFMPVAARLLSPTGVLYMVLVLENEPLQLATLVSAQYGLLPRIVARTQARNEKLFVMRFQRRAT